MGCVIEISSMMFDPGIVAAALAAAAVVVRGRQHSTPATKGRERRSPSCCATPARVEIVDDIRAAKWMKLVSNATTLVTTAILGLPILEAVKLPGMRELMLQLRPGGPRCRRRRSATRSCRSSA